MGSKKIIIKFLIQNQNMMRQAANILFLIQKGIK